MSVFDKWERRVESELRRVLTGVLGSEKLPDCVELLHRLVEDLSRDCIASAGERKLPFKYLAVRVGVQDEGLRAAMAETFRSRSTLTAGIRRGLEELGCACQRPMRIDAVAVEEAVLDSPQRGYDYSGSLELPPPSTLKLTITRGSAVRTVYMLQQRSILIGRDHEIHDRKGSLIRRNDVVFLEPIVSRTHARIEFDDETVRYRLFDDSSRAGSVIFRGNQSVVVPSGSTGGAWLSSGDEIHFGSARLLVEIY